jgi:hypothetical protein
LALAVSNRLDHLETPQLITFKTNLVDYYRHHDYAHLRVLAHEAKKLSELDSALNLLFASFCRQYKIPLQPV